MDSAAKERIEITLLLDALFQALEEITTKNRAYREVIRREPNAKHLKNHFDFALKRLLALSEAKKYGDLHNRAICALQDRSLDEFVQLAREVLERSHMWG